MFVKAKKILASELMYAKDMDEETCAEWLEEVLASDSPAEEEAGGKKKAPAAAPPSRAVLPDMSVWAILVAAGRGERLGLDRPKAFAKLGTSRSSPSRCAGSRACPWVDGIVLVAPPGWEEPAILLAEEEGCGKVHACVTGGRRGAIPCGRDCRRCPAMRSSSSCTTRHGRSSRTKWSSACWRRSPRAGTASCPVFPWETR
jgi:hypothetical protein